MKYFALAILNSALIMGMAAYTYKASHGDAEAFIGVYFSGLALHLVGVAIGAISVQGFTK